MILGSWDYDQALHETERPGGEPSGKTVQFMLAWKRMLNDDDDNATL